MREEDHNVEYPRPARRRKLRLVSTEALPATQLEIDKYHLRLHGIRTRQLARRRTPIVNGNFTALLARSILMVRSITGWIGFRIWCEALYYGRQEHEVEVEVLGGGGA